jgi:pimeloyl-ACP methyl ester carboxylesterase
MKRKILKWSGAFVLIIILLISIFTSFLYSKQEKMIFAASQLPADYMFEFDHPFEEVNLKTDDGVNLNGFHFKVSNPKGIIIYFHGNASDWSRWGNIAGDFTKLQYDVLVVDYRYYGKSTGVVDEQKMLDDTQL